MNYSNGTTRSTTGDIISEPCEIVAASWVNSDASVAELRDGANGAIKYVFRTPTAGGDHTVTFCKPLRFKNSVYLNVTTTGTAPVMSVAALTPTTP